MHTQANAPRTALVTGASRGIGLGVARALAGRGLRVIITARGRAKAEAAVAALRGEGLAGELVAEEVDVADDDSVRALAGRLAAAGRHVDVLVNNAGVLLEVGREHVGTFDIASALILEAINTNTLGAMRMCQALCGSMNQAGYGRVVNVSSGMGALTDMDGGWPAYRISKAALSAVTRLFHNEARGDVKVNSVCPGWVRTAMGGANAPRSIEEGAAAVVAVALLPADGPSGAFFRGGQVIPW